MNSKLYIRIYLFLALILIGSFSVTNAQTSNYTFTQGIFSDQQYYVPLSSSAPFQYYAYYTNLSSPNFSTNPLTVLYTGSDTGTIAVSATGNGYPIGFNFVYNGESFDRVAISGNGYIKLGHSDQPFAIKSDTLPGEIFDGSSDNQNVLASFQTDATSFNPNNNAPILFMYGVPGNRTFVIQFSDVTGSGILMVHQIQLMERNDIIGFAYPDGGYDLPNTYLQGAIGLTGNNDFTNLKIVSGTNTWQTAIQGSLSADLCDFNNSVLPPGTGYENKSFMYIWTPPVPAPSAPTCPFVYFLSADTTGFPNKNNILYGGAINNYAGSTYYISANGATIAPNNPILNWSDDSIASNQTTTYDVYLDIDNPPLVPVIENLAATSYSLPILAPNTTYYYDIVPRNASGKDSACIGSFTTDSIPQYCQNGSDDVYINSFNLNNLSFVLTSANKFTSRFPATAPYTTTLKRDTSYTFSVTLVGQINGAPWSSADVGVWIDFNQDGSFNDLGDTIVGGSGGPNGSFTFNVPIPTTAKLGQTVMRVAAKNVADISDPLAPCTIYDFGGSQDFIITIGPASGCTTFNINPVINNVNCFGQSNGSISLNPSGGSIPYTVNWTNGSSADEITNLTKGIYQATVTDANSCEIGTPLIPVLQPMALSVDTATGSNNITTILASGGTAPYSYLWNNGDTSSNSSNLAAGTYSVTVTDAHGCDTTMQNIVIKQTTQGTIPPPPPPPVDSVKDSSVNIIVYPNPTSGIVYLQSQVQQTIHVQIVSEQGKVLLQGDYIMNTNVPASINVASFADGIYFLKVVGDKSSTVVKIIKQ
jgi:hypothetical protein